MSTYTERLPYTGSPEYDKHFWNAMRGHDSSFDELANGRSTGTGLYAMPNTAHNKYVAALEKESLFRSIGTVIKAYGSGYRIFAKDSADLAQWVAENDTIPIYNGIEDFTINTVDSWKLAAFVKMDAAFINDASFDIENYLINRFAKNFGRAEDNAFINGNGSEMPTGILNDTNGADLGITTAEITYDKVISLYFSVKPEYRKNAIWLMNDATHLLCAPLRTVLAIISGETAMIPFWGRRSLCPNICQTQSQVLSLSPLVILATIGSSAEVPLEYAL